MAVVVIVIMFGFIGSDYLQWLGRGRTRHETVAYFLDNLKITNDDLAAAQRELEILKMLRADELLRAQDLRGVLLSELLFSERRPAPALINQIRQTIRTNNYRISDQQISQFYKRSMPGHVYWLLLENEVKLVGLQIPNDDVGSVLGRAVPQLFNGQSYSQLAGAMANQHGVSEELLLATFGKLLTVFHYAQMVCSSEDVTGSQIMHAASRENEAIDVEFVKFDSAVFAKTLPPPNEEIILEHLDKYKKFSPGTITDENPYGFGYKLPDRAGLEYIALKLDDVLPLVTLPTQEETEEYYQKNRERLFTEEVPSDPNDPNSPVVQQTKGYAEVANIISNQLLQNKVISRAEKIIEDARALTEANWKDTDLATVNAEKLKQMAGDYKAAAGQLTEKHKIRVYTGQTGLLSAADMQMDKYLANLYLQGYGYGAARLSQITFAIDELAASELGPFDIPKPRLYENIGPIRDPFSSAFGGPKDFSGQIMALVRIIKAVKAAEPESINETFSTQTLELEPNQPSAGTAAPEPNKADPNSSKGSLEKQKVFSVKEKVAEDLKKLAAMDTTKSKAEEFIALAAKDGWDSALGKFNELYRPLQDENEPNVFVLQSFPNLRRISSAVLQTLTVQSAGSPVAGLMANEYKKQARFVEQLYLLVPPDSNTPAALPLIMEFKPEMSFYCLKGLSVGRLYREDYEKIKARQLFREDQTQAESMAVVHFSPENILNRMKFRKVTEDEGPPEANTPAESGGPSQ